LGHAFIGGLQVSLKSEINFHNCWDKNKKILVKTRENCTLIDSFMADLKYYPVLKNSRALIPD